MSNELPKKFKIVVPQGMSEQIQEKLFSLGYRWLGGEKKVQLTSRPFLLVEDNAITYLDMCDSEIFFSERMDHEEIAIKHLMAAKPEKLEDNLSEKEIKKHEELIEKAIELIKTKKPFILIYDIDEKGAQAVGFGVTDSECIVSLKSLIRRIEAPSMSDFLRELFK